MASGTSTAGKRLRQGAISLGWALAGVIIAILLWEGVKLLGVVVTLPFETSNQAMPHVWTIAEGALQPEVRGSDTPVWVTVLRAAIYTLVIAFGGFIIGVAVGLLLAVIMRTQRGPAPFGAGPLHFVEWRLVHCPIGVSRVISRHSTN
jgi:ABC-type phosphate/phosphonate transport system permease subunit